MASGCSLPLGIILQPSASQAPRLGLDNLWVISAHLCPFLLVDLKEDEMAVSAHSTSR